MKKLSLAITFVVGLAVSASAQVKPNLTANNHTNTPKTTAAVPAAISTRTRFTEPNPNVNNQVVALSSTVQQWGNAPLATTAVVQPTVARATAVTPPLTALTQTYRVGVGDILDIQLPDSHSTGSTLYTISENGMIDYPLASGPVHVNGLTTDAIAARLKANIRVLDGPPVMVKVRDFASHSVNVIGFVQLPGSKILRREAVPLYVLLAEAMPLSEATSVTVVRSGRTLAQVDLKNVLNTNQLILPGDIIKVSDRAIGAK